jgi:phospholipid-binding lipoprotein MlaA
MRTIIAVCLLTLATGCATTGGNPRDPWEGFNRPVYAFNDAVDRAVLKPVAQGYVKVVPEFARTGVNNFFGNIEDIATGVNNILQGKPAEGVNDLGRVVVNSVVGIFGLFDVASPMGLDKHNEDFGQTLGWWGVPSGPYLVLPLMGPSTLRDAPARYVDSYMGYNASWLEYDWEIRTGLTIVDVVRIRSNLLQAERVLDDAALDKYSFIRDAWMQRRRNQVYDGKPPKDLDDQ